MNKTLLADTYEKEQAEIDACMKRGGYRPATEEEKTKNLKEIQGLYQAKRL